MHRTTIIIAAFAVFWSAAPAAAHEGNHPKFANGSKTIVPGGSDLPKEQRFDNALPHEGAEE